MVSAANGAEDFYSTDDHVCRSEGVELARELDYKAAAAWVGHPYFDVIDNSQDFETKICRMIECVCQKLGIDTGDRLRASSRKVKFLVKAPLPADNEFPPFQDFDVVHNYLQSNNPKMQARLRKRGQKGIKKKVFISLLEFGFLFLSLSITVSITVDLPKVKLVSGLLSSRKMRESLSANLER